MLNLDISRIRSTLKSYHSVLKVSKYIPEDTYYKLKVYLTDKKLIFHFQFNDDGTTTILRVIGPKPITTQITQYLIDHCVIDRRTNISITYKSDKFNALMFHLVDCGAKLIHQDSTDGYHLVKMQSKYKDTLTFKVYHN